MPNLIQTGMEVLAKDLSKIPKNKKGALVIMVDNKATRFGVVSKFDSGWHMSAGLIQQWEKKLPDAYVYIGKVW